MERDGKEKTGYLAMEVLLERAACAQPNALPELEGRLRHYELLGIVRPYVAGLVRYVSERTVQGVRQRFGLLELLDYDVGEERRLLERKCASFRPSAA